MKKYSEKRVISFVGYSGSGKTTFIVKLIEELKSRGLTLALIKHDAHEFDIDHEGKDTYKFYQSGADIVTIFSKTKCAMTARYDAVFKEAAGIAPAVRQIIKSFPDNIDIVIVEGCRESDIPKIGFSRKATNKGLSMKPKDLSALITDEVSLEYLSENPSLIVFGLDDVKEVADYVESGEYMYNGIDEKDYSDSCDRIYAEKPDIKTISQIIEKLQTEGIRETVDLRDAGGRVAFDDIVFKNDHPLFPMASCDGYAFRAEDTYSASAERPVSLKLTESINAGVAPEYVISRGYAAEISEGARLPYGADIIESKEFIKKDGERLIVDKEYIHEKNIIPEGSIYKKGYVIAKKGEKITPEKLEILCVAGYKEINVCKIPKAFIIGTGTELSDSDSSENDIKIKNSTAYLAGSLAKEASAEAVYYGTVKDNTEEIADKLRKAMSEADIIITTGGASDGINDYTLKAFKSVGAKIIIWQTAASPLLNVIVAKKKDKLLIGLPGTPKAADIAMRLIGQPLIKAMSGLYGNPRPAKLILSKTTVKSFAGEEYITGNIEFDDTMAFFTPKISDPEKGFFETPGTEAVGILPEGKEAAAGTIIDAYIFV